MVNNNYNNLFINFSDNIYTSVNNISDKELEIFNENKNSKLYEIPNL